MDSVLRASSPVARRRAVVEKARVEVKARRAMMEAIVGRLCVAAMGEGGEESVLVSGRSEASGWSSKR